MHKIGRLRPPDFVFRSNMKLDVVGEEDIPEGVLRLLATPVSRSLQTWYMGCFNHDSSNWTIATVWRESQRDGATSACWGLALRGAACLATSESLVNELLRIAPIHGCMAIVIDAIAVNSPFDSVLAGVGFTPLRSYRTVGASTIAAMRGLGLGVRGQALVSSGWTVSPPQPHEFHLLIAGFLKELGHIPPHLMHLVEDYDTAKAMDQTLVLRRNAQLVGALVGRKINRGIDLQGLLCHPRWRSHRALSWLLAESTSRWPLIADDLVFSFPEDNLGMVDIARRIEARTLVRRRDLVRRVQA